jgi:alcohol dehydrogenase
MTEQVQAALFRPKTGLALELLSLPSPDVGEVLVDVLGCTICGSDLHTIDGRRAADGPTILGHEIVGRVKTIADAATDMAGRPLAVGDRVTWAVVAACGDCFFCQRDLPQKCLHATKFGHQPLATGRELVGGLAEVCLLPRATSIVTLPDELPLAVACPASCATATSAAAVQSLGHVRGGEFVVFGLGMLGLSTIAMLATAGAARVVGVDPSPQRCQLALRFGASQTCMPDELVTLAPRWGFDAAIEMSGHPAAFDAAWQTTRTGGTLVLVGSVFPTAGVPVELEKIVRRQLTIRGIHNYAPTHLAMAVDFLARHHSQFPFAECVERWVALADLNTALATSRNGAIRVGVRPHATDG